MLPWQDRARLQRNPACCRRHCQQAGQVSRKCFYSGACKFSIKHLKSFLFRFFHLVADSLSFNIVFIINIKLDTYLFKWWMLSAEVKTWKLCFGLKMFFPPVKTILSSDPTFTLPPGTFLSLVVIRVGEITSSFSTSARRPVLTLGCAEETAQSCRLS